MLGGLLLAAEQLLSIYEEGKSNRKCDLGLKFRDYRYYIHSSMPSRLLIIGGRTFIEFIVVNFVCGLCTKSVVLREKGPPSIFYRHAYANCDLRYYINRSRQLILKAPSNRAPFPFCACPL